MMNRKGSTPQSWTKQSKKDQLIAEHIHSLAREGDLINLKKALRSGGRGPALFLSNKTALSHRRRLMKDQQGNLLLHSAVKGGNPRVWLYLLKDRRCVDLVDVPNAKGFSPFTLACYYACKKPSADRLMMLGTMITLKPSFFLTNKHDQNVLHFAAQYGCFHIIQILQQFASSEAWREAIKQVDKNGCTPLHFAVSRSHLSHHALSVMMIALSDGEDLLFSRDSAGNTPFLYACSVPSFGKKNFAKLLPSEAAIKDRNTTWNNFFKVGRKTAFHKAVEAKCVDNLSALTEIAERLNLHWKAMLPPVDHISSDAIRYFLHSADPDLFPAVEDNCPTPRLSSKGVPIVRFSDLLLQKRLGEGHFGLVRKARWGSRKVAVKMPKENVNMQFLNMLKEEANVMMRLKPHPNVVALVGVTTKPFSIVTEYVDGGNLRTKLERELLESSRCLSLTASGEPQQLLDPQQQNVRRLAQYALHIAQGMHHLHESLEECVVHRDLALRNILISKEGVCKVADFGLSRVTRMEEDRTLMDMIPFRCLAPEVFHVSYSSSSSSASSSFVYSKKTDVWDFGVTFWELWTLKDPLPTHHPFANGKTKKKAPLIVQNYHSMTSPKDKKKKKQQKKKTKKEKKKMKAKEEEEKEEEKEEGEAEVGETKERTPLERPNNCPDVLWELMCWCWKEEPSQRPSFADLVERLSALLEEECIPMDGVININDDDATVSSPRMGEEGEYIDSNEDLLSLLRRQGEKGEKEKEKEKEEEIKLRQRATTITTLQRSEEVEKEREEDEEKSGGRKGRSASVSGALDWCQQARHHHHVVHTKDVEEQHRCVAGEE
ncbi:fibroblast growth factor receptor 1-like [Balamuthia mandrillaris]